MSEDTLLGSLQKIIQSTVTLQTQDSFETFFCVIQPTFPLKSTKKASENTERLINPGPTALKRLLVLTFLRGNCYYPVKLKASYKNQLWWPALDVKSRLRFLFFG